VVGRVDVPVAGSLLDAEGDEQLLESGEVHHARRPPVVDEAMDDHPVRRAYRLDQIQVRERARSRAKGATNLVRRVENRVSHFWTPA
jgi:hypothetical protein